MAGASLIGFGEAGALSKKGPTPAKRLIVSVEGKERVGKTTFGLSAPGPIAFFPIDPGREGVLEKVIKNKKILLPIDEKGNIETFDYRDATSAKDYERLWEKFKKCYTDALNAKEIRSIVVDTFTEIYELIRLARFGKLTQVQPYHYGPINAEMRDLVKQVYKTDKNLILIHKVRHEYINEKKTGNLERAGWSDVGYQVQINLRLSWDQENGFSMKVFDCRQEMSIAGSVMGEPMNSFPYLATAVYPDTELEYWG